MFSMAWMKFYCNFSHFFWSNPSFICFLCNHNFTSSSAIVSIPFLSYVFSSIPTALRYYIRQSFQDFFISSFISLYSLSILLMKRNSSWLIHVSIKALEIRISILFDLVFPKNTISSCFFFFFFLDNWLIRFNCSDGTNF